MEPKLFSLGPLPALIHADREAVEQFDPWVQTSPFGLFAVPSGARCESFRRDLSPRFHISERNVFSGQSALVRDACREIIKTFRLPTGWTYEAHLKLKMETIAEITALTKRLKGAPYPSDVLAGNAFPHMASLIRGSDGTLLAFCFGALPFPEDSMFSGMCYGGGLILASDARGHGLGTFITAKCIFDSIDALGWDTIWAEVRVGNKIGQQIIEQCGLTLNEDLISLVLS